MIDFRRANAGFHFHIRSMGCKGSSTATACTFTALALVTGATGSSLVACSDLDPQMPVPPEQEAVVTVGADLRNPEQAALAYVYAQSFERIGRQAEVVGIRDADDRLRAVRSEAVLVSFGCTGELLGLSDPASAASLAEEYAEDSTPDKQFSGEWRDRVYDAFSRSLPGEVMATDAGMAQGCADVSADNAGADLPQWLVPFYVKPALDRDDRVRVLNEIAGSLSTEDLKLMTRAVAGGASPELVAQEWLDKA
ncbi:hypothetical protein QP923_06605 [Corynebacterium sp. MSK151]|uniref:hypothetical protein n=1 Tax=unclassified Corynebacterium TaxID=2624378 RepID=UPI00254BB4CF|nr:MULTISPECIES: hypothetical protein [unclassified Corynebacterium]MDK8759266.1 hypothetical protein [Corynebacterium sp. MSK151]MDK8848400.1 hypothetical protein [Corynebacterium sp. MSK047]